MSVMDESSAIIDGPEERTEFLEVMQETNPAWTTRTLADFLAVQRWMRDDTPKEVVDISHKNTFDAPSPEPTVPPRFAPFNLPPTSLALRRSRESTSDAPAGLAAHALLGELADARDERLRLLALVFG